MWPKRKNHSPLAQGYRKRGAPSDYYEREAFSRGYVRIAGIDEAGRGPLAGPVVAAAVVLPPGLCLPGVRDSKIIGEQEREELYHSITQKALSIGIGVVDHFTIDKINILQATILAMKEAVASIDPPPDYLLIDALHLPAISLSQKDLIRGERCSVTIAAASIVAKVTRDRMMREYHVRYPRYNFAANKGYGTKDHLAQIRLFGPCDIHRRTFRGVKDYES